MRLQRLATRGLRNLAPGELHTDASFVVFSGLNAQGKTNALEAIWFLATLRPLRGFVVRDLIAWGEEEAAVGGTVDGHALKVMQGKSRRLFLEGQAVTQLSQYFGAVRAVAFSPSDEEVLRGEPRLRRQWLDRAAFTADPSHLDLVRAYHRALDQKRALLRSPDPVLLDVLDEQLARTGAAVAEARERMLSALEPHVTRYHRELSGDQAVVEPRYRTVAYGRSTADRTGALHDALQQARAEEVRRGMALVGPHRDEVRLLLDGRPARTWASRGQVRSLLLALKLAELQAARERGDAPLFLLDDLSSELDGDRTRRLVSILEGLGSQVFVTTTDPSHIQGLPEADTLHFSVREGQLSALPAAR
ncbi:MAG: DNA replication and repair protein RecF [Deltaproteobacteria bacterium]|nr:DNA replication and repair protein RecF [Deltaproteobacteria bacterium]